MDSLFVDLKGRAAAAVVAIGFVGMCALILTAAFLYQATTWKQVSARVDSIAVHCLFDKNRRRSLYRYVDCSDIAAATELKQRGYEAKGPSRLDIRMIVLAEPPVEARMIVPRASLTQEQARIGAVIQVQQSRIFPSRAKPLGHAWNEFRLALVSAFILLTIFALGIRFAINQFRDIFTGPDK